MWKSHDFIVEAPRDVAPVENKHLELAGEPQALVASCFSAWDWDSPQPQPPSKLKPRPSAPAQSVLGVPIPALSPRWCLDFLECPQTWLLPSRPSSVGLSHQWGCSLFCTVSAPGSGLALLLCPPTWELFFHSSVMPKSTAHCGGSSQGRLCLACS